MASPVTNWACERGVVHDSDRKALERAKKLEKHDAKKGYKWYRIDERNKIFVPFGKDGHPTKEGYESIERFKAHLGIK